MRSIRQCLDRAVELVPASDSARLDTEVLLAFALARPRSHLYAWPEKHLSSDQLERFNQLFDRRRDGEPVAYLVGEREFWSLPLAVNQHTLIPRPATETLVEQALIRLPKNQPLCVLDLGTGTGAIALALASERPECALTAVEQSLEALALARTNAQRLNLNNVEFCQSHWYQNISKCFDVIVSNPPYIDSDDPNLDEGDVRFEPRSALVADNAGFSDLQEIITAAPEYLTHNGWLLLEHGYQQAVSVCEALMVAGFAHVETVLDADGHPRVSFGQWQKNEK